MGNGVLKSYYCFSETPQRGFNYSLVLSNHQPQTKVYQMQTWLLVVLFNDAQGYPRHVKRDCFLASLLCVFTLWFERRRVLSCFQYFSILCSHPLNLRGTVLAGSPYRSANALPNFRTQSRTSLWGTWRHVNHFWWFSTWLLSCNRWPLLPTKLCLHLNMCRLIKKKYYTISKV